MINVVDSAMHHTDILSMKGLWAQLLRVLMAGKLRSQGFGEIASPWLKVTLLPELVHLY